MIETINHIEVYYPTEEIKLMTVLLYS